MTKTEHDRQQLSDTALSDGADSDAWRIWSDNEPELATLADILNHSRNEPDRLSRERRQAVLDIAQLRQARSRRLRLLAFAAALAAAVVIAAGVILYPGANQPSPSLVPPLAHLAGEPSVNLMPSKLSVDAYAADFDSQMRRSRERLGRAKRRFSGKKIWLKPTSTFRHEANRLRQDLAEKQSRWQENRL